MMFVRVITTFFEGADFYDREQDPSGMCRGGEGYHPGRRHSIGTMSNYVKLGITGGWRGLSTRLAAVITSVQHLCLVST